VDSAATRSIIALAVALRNLAGRSAAVLDAAAAWGFTRCALALLRDLDERRDALSRPIEESERRLLALRRAIVETEHAKGPTSSSPAS
jgi:hypothetical protein